MQTPSLVSVTIALLSITSPLCKAADPFEGYYEKEKLASCQPSFDNYTPEGCPVKEGLEIKRRDKSSYYVWIHTEGDNGHFCSYRGIARKNKDRLVSRGDDCKVYISFKNGVAKLGGDGEACNTNYCGVRAGLWADKLVKMPR